jgi:hypothetical protein
MTTMRVVRHKTWACVGVLAMALASVAVFAGSAPAGATTGPPFTQCPAVGQDTSCGLLVTINPGGTVSVTSDPSQGPFDGVEDTLVGVQNNAAGFVSNISLSGPSIFGFDSDGICTYSFTGDGYCSTLPAGSYEGPDNTFTVTDASDGAINFLGGGLAPGASTYFSLEGTPTPGTINLVPVVVGTPASVSAVEGTAFTSQTVASFTDSDPNATAAGFSATINWGDGSPTVSGTVSGPQGGPYTVTGGHTYTDEASDTVTVTITDLALTANTSTVQSTATVSDAALSGTGVSFDATTGTTTGTITVATFTDANPLATASDFTANVNWGDGSPVATGTVAGPTGGPFTVTAAHVFTAPGTDTVSVGITDKGGSTTSATSTATVATAVIPCPAGQSCSGTATIPNTMSVTVTGDSTTNAVIVVQVGLGTLSCGDPFLHAPDVTTQTESGYSGTTDKVVTLDINKSVVGNKFFLFYQVCYSGTTPFTDIFGHRNVTTGVLPYCILVRNQAPCTISTTKSSSGDVIEKFKTPPGDPRYH